MPLGWIRADIRSKSIFAEKVGMAADRCHGVGAVDLFVGVDAALKAMMLWKERVPSSRLSCRMPRSLN
jgi:hypothetical protein